MKRQQNNRTMKTVTIPDAVKEECTGATRELEYMFEMIAKQNSMTMMRNRDYEVRRKDGHVLVRRGQEGQPIEDIICNVSVDDVVIEIPEEDG